MAASLSLATGQSEVAVLFTPCQIGRAFLRVTAVGDAFLWGRGAGGGMCGGACLPNLGHLCEGTLARLAAVPA